MKTATRFGTFGMLLVSIGCGDTGAGGAVLPGPTVDGGGPGPLMMPSMPVMTTTTDETWADGKHLDLSVTIASAAHVLIAPGATITAATGVVITVQGSLKAMSAASHAKITGASWGGIVVASGGTLALDGVDLANATTALDVKSGDTAAAYDDGVISASKAPFLVEAGGKLSTSRSHVTGTKGQTHVSGALIASRLDYDANGNEGIVTDAPAATVSIEDSVLYGPGPVADMVVSAGGAASIHVAYTEIKSVHCAFHFDTIDAFDIDHVDAHDDAYGFMMYGSSSTGTRAVKGSNLSMNDIGIDERGTNGRITVSDGYWARNGSGPADNAHLTDTAVVITNMSTTTPIADAKPRP